MTTSIQRIICHSEVLKANSPCENVSNLFSDWEADVLSLSRRGYVVEFEVKISRSDFKADFKKRKFEYYKAKIKDLTPNRFYYVCPKGLIDIDEVPDFAGLIYVDNGKMRIIKKAPQIHSFKHDANKIRTKFLRVQTERQYLGSCRLTYKNNEIKKRASYN